MPAKRAVDEVRHLHAERAGTVDSDYRGEMMVPLINLGRAAFTVEHGMRVAQMVVAPVARATVREVEELDRTARGQGGFGSTGR